jgi:hypothetical protein
MPHSGIAHACSILPTGGVHDFDAGPSNEGARHRIHRSHFKVDSGKFDPINNNTMIHNFGQQIANINKQWRSKSGDSNRQKP